MRIAVAALLACLSLASARADVAVRTAEPGAKPLRAKVTDIAWLEGAWVGSGLGGETEEAYAAPLAGTIVGYFRFVKDSKPVFYEIVTLVEEGGGVVMRLKHFHPNLVGWEEKDKSQEFPLIAIEGQTAYFDGMTMKREGDKLFSAVRIRMKDGTTKVEQFVYDRKR
jgi:hypothetical protein